MDFEQALQQLKQAQDDPQALTVATAQIVCARSHPKLFEILEAAAIPHWINAEILAALLQTDTVTASDWLEMLIQLPMVETFSSRQAWNVHETTRLALRTTLAKNDPERFRTFTRLAANHFSGSEDALRIEHIYHRLEGTETGADKQLNDLYQEWRRNGRYETQQSLALVLEELLRSDLISGGALARTLVVLGWIRQSRMPLTLADSLARQAVALFVEAGDEYGEADARDWLGRTLQSEGKLADALREFQKQMEIMRRLTERDPDNTDWLRDLSISHNNVGRVLQDQGNLAGALREFQAYMDIMRRLTERDPDNTDWQRELSVSHNNVGRVLQDQGNLAGALKEFQAYMDIMRRLTERDPDNTDWLRDLSVSHNNVGRVLQAQGNLAGALKEFQAGMDIRRRLTERDPDNTGWLRDLSVSHNNVGRVLQDQGNLAGALKEFQAYMDIMRRLTERDPDNTDWLRDLSVSHNNVGRVLQAQGNLAGALKEFQACMDIMTAPDRTRPGQYRLASGLIGLPQQRGPGAARPGQSGRGAEGIPGGHGHHAAPDRTRPGQHRLASGAYRSSITTWAGCCKTKAIWPGR